MKKVAIIIGHSKLRQGAKNKRLKMSEYKYNKGLGEEIASFSKVLMEDHKVDLRAFERWESINTMVGRVNKWNPDLVISLHCNAYNKKVSGGEILLHNHYRGVRPENGTDTAEFKVLAEELIKLCATDMAIPNRGIVYRNSNQAGGYMLSRLDAKRAMLLESFFIDNDEDLQKGILFRFQLARRLVIFSRIVVM